MGDYEILFDIGESGVKDLIDRADRFLSEAGSLLS